MKKIFQPWTREFITNFGLLRSGTRYRGITIFQTFVRFSKLSNGGGGVLPYKSDGGARRKISRTPLKGTRILFYGCVLNSFPPFTYCHKSLS